MLLAVLIVAVTFASPASADSRIRAGNCDPYLTAVLDPIAKTLHNHQFYGGRLEGLSNSSTGFDAKARAVPTCKSDFSQWLTSIAWSPIGKSVRLTNNTFYYRDPGDLRVRPIPTDLRMLNSQAILNGGNSVTVHFGNCLKVNASGQPILDSVDHKSHIVDRRANACPSTHPYRIPRISYLQTFSGSVNSSTLFSMGNNQWGTFAEFYHADYLSAVQDPFNYATSQGKALIDLCLNDVPNSVNVAHQRCGPDPNG